MPPPPSSIRRRCFFSAASLYDFARAKKCRGSVDYAAYPDGVEVARVLGRRRIDLAAARELGPFVRRELERVRVTGPAVCKGVRGFLIAPVDVAAGDHERVRMLGSAA